MRVTSSGTAVSLRAAYTREEEGVCLSEFPVCGRGEGRGGGPAVWPAGRTGAQGQADPPATKRHLVHVISSPRTTADGCRLPTPGLQGATSPLPAPLYDPVSAPAGDGI